MWVMAAHSTAPGRYRTVAVAARFSAAAAILAACAPGLGAADKPNREIQELQRDVAQLQEVVKAMQRSLEDRIATLGTQVQGAADSAGKAVAAIGGVQKSVERAAQDQDTKLSPAIGTLGTRLDQVSGALTSVQQSISDLTSTVTQLQSQIGDLTNLVKVIQQPVTPPAPTGPPMGATELWQNAERDRMSGKYDLAAREYQDYLTWFSNGPRAADAQYYLGFSYYSLKEYERALQQFDTVIEKYPRGARTPEALFNKGKTLTALNRADEAAAAYRKLRTRFPNHTLVRQIPH
jgi:tol-pal system protein YbgF